MLQEFGFTGPNHPLVPALDDGHLKALLRPFLNRGGNILGYRVWQDGSEEEEEFSGQVDRMLKPLIDLLRPEAERVTVETLVTKERDWYALLSAQLAEVEVPTDVSQQLWAAEHEKYGRFMLKYWGWMPEIGVEYTWELLWISEEGLRHACVDAGIDLDAWRATPGWTPGDSEEKSQMDEIDELLEGLVE